MAIIDVDKLREYMFDHIGSAVFNGSPAAIIDVMQIENMDPYELCRKAEDLGIDLNRFRVVE